MAEKSFVDVIQDRTRQLWRRSIAPTTKPAVEERPRVGRWPPPRQAEWRLEFFKPWKVKD